MAIAYLGLGSNLGDRELNLQKAIEFLQQEGVKVLAVSTILETVPLGGLDQPQYLNTTLKVETELSPQELLQSCFKVEDLLGRVRNKKWDSRTIDVDVLIYDDLQIDTPELTIPHPGVKDRDFVRDGLKELGFELVQ